MLEIPKFLLNVSYGCGTHMGLTWYESHTHVRHLIKILIKLLGSVVLLYLKIPLHFIVFNFRIYERERLWEVKTVIVINLQCVVPRQIYNIIYSKIIWSGRVDRVYIWEICFEPHTCKNQHEKPTANHIILQNRLWESRSVGLGGFSNFMNSPRWQAHYMLLFYFHTLSSSVLVQTKSITKLQNPCWSLLQTYKVVLYRCILASSHRMQKMPYRHIRYLMLCSNEIGSGYSFFWLNNNEIESLELLFLFLSLFWLNKCQQMFSVATWRPFFLGAKYAHRKYLHKYQNLERDREENTCN